MPADPAHFQDVSCSFCGRHNREVRVVASAAGLVICQVCVARCAEVVDDEAGVEPPPGGWPRRWPLKVLSEAVGEAPGRLPFGCLTAAISWDSRISGPQSGNPEAAW